MTTRYIAYGVSLSDNQRMKLAKAFKEKSPITLRLSHNELTGSDEMMLTQTQIKKIHKAVSAGKGVDLKISKTQITKVAQKGGSLFSSLLTKSNESRHKNSPTPRDRCTFKCGQFCY